MTKYNKQKLGGKSWDTISLVIVKIHHYLIPNLITTADKINFHKKPFSYIFSITLSVAQELFILGIANLSYCGQYQARMYIWAHFYWHMHRHFFKLDIYAPYISINTFRLGWSLQWTHMRLISLLLREEKLTTIITVLKNVNNNLR